MSNVTMKELLEAGVHFGHETKRWDPKMKPYIFGARNGIYIIDLQKTVLLFKEACQFVREVASRGEYILFVGTKKQAQETIFEQANRCGMFYVNHRWLGGMMTNFQTIKRSIDRLNQLEAMKNEGDLKVRWRALDEHRALVEFEDQGAGIPPEILPRVGEPFFTTKNGGTGLGVAIAQRIVERHGGTLSFKSTPGRGTVARVSLPVEIGVLAEAA